MISRRRRKHSLPEVSLTPMIDTALVLLVIFMVATPMMHNSLKIDLPEGNMKEGIDMTTSSFVVAITQGDKLQLNGTSHSSLEGLLNELSAKVKTAKDKRVYVDCDKNVSSGMLVKVIDSIKYIAGVEHVILSTERVK
jgi:biopolymer transport protein ExbD